MHFVRAVTYRAGYQLLLEFEDGSSRLVDLEPHLDGEIFEPLKDIAYFKTVRVDKDIDTIVWSNGADMSPDFLFEIGTSMVEMESTQKQPNKRQPFIFSFVMRSSFMQQRNRLLSLHWIVLFAMLFTIGARGQPGGASVDAERASLASKRRRARPAGDDAGQRRELGRRPCHLYL
ncbi:MAG: DUF2442 domain-containing protein [Anaerolineales bacterium]|nr:DUF2442 domain-containing protein [Anaerolineales bacterium]